MYMMYYLNDKGERVYSLKKTDPNGMPTFSAHPARYSPADNFSRERIIIKRRHKLLLTQKPVPAY
ncbi:H/ACA ribonucleoprotein complex subunit 3 [Cimex lectularius]|uniref:Nucleolar protein 10 n=1 Tax=Cimex lectularius TaxID=79782 RepID=A0A8I6TGX8_CIMLE|nr:H/ACA ribonucleoprotein complex subunit 3 [Cimex lectularius]